VKRVAIVGSGGAGKSVLARDLAARTGLPRIHLDRYFWHPGWVETPDPEWQALHAELIAGDRWIIDGNYGSTMEARLARADTVLLLDLPRLVCVVSALQRQWRYRGGGRDDMVEGQRERFDLAFMQWIWRYPERSRPQVLDRLSRVPATTTIHRLRSRSEVREYLAGIAPAPAHEAEAAA
jgi:adenylate kinase family enzyme